MKMHRILAEAAADIAKSVFKEHRVLDHALAAAFEENPKWGKRDRSFIAETVFEVVRWRRALGFLADSEEANAMCAAQWVRMGYEIPAWWTFKGLQAAEMRAREADLAAQPRAVRESIPDWLDQLGVSELGGAWDAQISALNQRAAVFLRVNTLKTTRTEAIEWLASCNVEATAVPGLPDALVLAPGKALPKPLRTDGRVEIQDAGSQLISPLVDPQPGERVIDACSGAGGKALHPAALMENQGTVYAMDVDPNATTPADFSNIADRLLIDAPCSGLGTLKRQPDLKWRLKPAQLVRVRAIQKELLATYHAMLKPGGRLVYATCSILPSENRAAIASLLEKGGFTLVEERAVSPAATGVDGFYAATLRKHDC
ncbi:MAG: RNA methyltransferase [Verrucomicrobia bacterium]|nr:RNA methyltransferase [Verrucomicrobiota bacterium]